MVYCRSSGVTNTETVVGQVVDLSSVLLQPQAHADTITAPGGIMGQLRWCSYWGPRQHSVFSET